MSDSSPVLPAVNLGELQALARERMEASAFDYYRGGADDEVALREGERALSRYVLRYRVLRDVGERSTATTVLGHRLRTPVVVAPTAFHCLAHPEGEVATARAAGRAGTVFTLSTLSNRPMEEVAAASEGPVWFQLYVYRDRAITAELVARAREAGCRAIVLTVDAPVLGRRERDVRNRFALPEGLTAANLLPAGAGAIGSKGDERSSSFARYVEEMFDPTLTFSDLEWLVATAELPVLVKGVVRADDARLAIEHGAAGVVVSNHGGRQLDAAPATIDVLAEVTDAVRSCREEALVAVDGGFRRGTDVVKALALGADSVLLGRPILWGLAAGGEDGVEQVLSMITSEVDHTLGLCGFRDIGSLRASGGQLVAKRC